MLGQKTITLFLGVKSGNLKKDTITLKLKLPVFYNNVVDPNENKI